MIGSTLNATDEQWHAFQCERAEAARTTFSREVTNRAMTLEQLLPLVGKCNATPIDRYPAAQVKLLRFSYGVQTFVGVKPGFVAHLEYSPLGWPEAVKSGTAPQRCVLGIGTSGLRESARQQFLQQLAGRQAAKVCVLSGDVIEIPIQPPCPYELADLNVLWAED